MIVVTGSLTGTAETIDQIVALSLEHVRRSRTEPGCLSHAVHFDVENPYRVVFLERWADHDALRAHFAVPASGAFVTAATKLTVEPPTLQIYDAAETRV